MNAKKLKKKTIVAYFQVISHHLPGGAEEIAR